MAEGIFLLIVALIASCIIVAVSTLVWLFISWLIELWRDD